MEQFLLGDGSFVTVLMIIGDNSKGPLNIEYQFSLGILFLEYDFDLVVRISYAAYMSYRDPAEAGNGAVGRRTNGFPHQVDLALYTASSVDNRKEMLEAALRAVCAHADGARMSQYEATEVRVRVAKGPQGEAFIFRRREIIVFCGMLRH